MSFKLYKLRFRRVFKRRRHQLEGAGKEADQRLERHFFKRLHHLLMVKRFLALWIVPVLILIGLTGWQAESLSGYYQHLEPTAGGIYREGVIGQFTNANPIYAVSDVDESVSSLIFASLFKYNSDNELVGDLASGYSLSTDGRTYTVYLRPNLTWQDGQPLTAADVVFTYHTIQNPAAQSPLQPSWQGVDVSAKGRDAVVFSLPNPLASFKYSLTNGIIPEHILGSVPPSRLRSVEFNTIDPIGAGPFVWSSLQTSGNEPGTLQDLIALSPFKDYHSGAPKLGGLVIHTYPTNGLAEQALMSDDIDGLAGLDTLPQGWSNNPQLHIYSFPLTAEAMVFFRESNPVLADLSAREALVLAGNRQQIASDLAFKAQVEREPLLPSQLGYNSEFAQPGFDLSAAKKTLESGGWTLASDGYWHKNGLVLGFDLYALDSAISRQVTSELKQQWQALGANVNVHLQGDSDFQNTLSTHSYDAVLYNISLGVDPDEYIYWDSSQADPRSATRLNLSELKDSNADAGLEAGRTRSNPELRVVKYQKFLQAWQANYPALALYQPNFFYVTNRPLYNLSDKNEINSPLGRYNNVANWEIRRTEVTD